ncbi:hypothetical protein IP92_03186 [Pseudoduganella flava]|uniref:Uncharacterized protein n=1 Tax=Pseudoduganella flava TaxID=871742 RepID=A0A562PR44_9BURK|nr:hypothetical protein [Pseudoduganella flava]QGZ42470.1 hypothetical protein GO485_27845 [Pseudoduganella flava]TWI46823.1 hypothetical protein IP92_03186 [Pseudoduganella flava]
MNRALHPYLLGTAAAVTVVLAALAGWALFGPRTPPPRAAADQTAQPAAARIERYGRALQDGMAGMKYVATEEQLARPRQGYRVTFETADASLLKARDDAANAARQAAWQQRFCTDELRGEMRARQVNVVTGRVVDGGGRTQYVADCVAGQPAPQSGPGGPLL